MHRSCNLWGKYASITEIRMLAVSQLDFRLFARLGSCGFHNCRCLIWHFRAKQTNQKGHRRGAPFLIWNARVKILIGNKNYSTWSLRPWLVLKHFEFDFTEEVLPLSGEGWKQNLVDRTPTGTVPVLQDGDLAIPETIAIIEYLADVKPDAAIWPTDVHDRARARALAAEMHAGFTALRSAAPMNLRADFPDRIDLDSVAANLHRLEVALGGALEKSGGPFLFGSFTAADAMFAPIATRIKTYHLPVSDLLQNWIEAIYALPAFQAWFADAMKETAIVPQDEIDMMGQPT